MMDMTTINSTNKFSTIKWKKYGEHQTKWIISYTMQNIMQIMR